MKKILHSLLIALSFVFVLNNEVKAQTASVSITYTGFLSCGGCVVCGTDYWCLNTLSSYCGNTAACLTKTFTDPCPPGSIVTSVSVQYFTADCNGGSLTGSINGSAVPTVNEGNTGCLCSNNPCGQSAPTTTGNFPCGLPSYNNGGSNSFQLCTGADVCISHAIINLTYAPASQAVPANAPGPITGPTSVCPGGNYNYSASSSNAASYIWSVPAGWTINGSATGSTINVTAGASGGNVCVQGTNLCGTSGQTCLAVSMASSSSAPASISATANPICPSNPTTLSVNGGSLGLGANWTWYAGSCNSAVIGTGTSITVSPATATTYYVNAVGTCNTTACASLLINVNGTQPTPGTPSGTASVCSGSTQVYSTTGSAGATSYNWTVPAGTTINSGQGTTSINVAIGSTAGNICVTATGACGTSAAACTPITITSTPTTPGSITGVTPVCLGNDNYSISAVGGATSYAWNVSGGGSVTGGQGTTAATVNWTTAGSYIVSVTASNVCGASTAATFPITINPNPTITITPSTTVICTGSTVATLTAAGGVTYAWTPDPTLSATTGSVVTASPTNTTTPTVYNVTGTDGNGCTNTANVSISANATPTVSVTGGGANFQNICSGGSVSTISLTSTPAGTVTWTCTNNTGIGVSSSTGAGNIPGYPAPTVAVQTVGVITANSLSGAGCSSTGSTDLTYTITINPLPGVTTPTINPASCGSSNGSIIGAAGTGGSGNYSYEWNNTGGFVASSTLTDSAGTYQLQVKDNVTGCIYSQNFTLPNAGAPPPPPVTASTMTVCAGGSTILSAPAVSGVTYSWTPSTGTGGTGNSFTVNNITLPSPYLVSVTSTSAGCTGVAETVSITVNPLPPTPTFSLPTTANDTSCQGSPRTLTVNSGTSTAVWYSNNIQIHVGSSYTPPANLPPGTYTFSIIDSVAVPGGCTNANQSANTVTLSLVVNPSPTAPSTTSNSLTNECQNQSPPDVLNATPTGTVSSVPVWYNGSTYLTTGNTYTPPVGTVTTTVYTVIDSSIVAPNHCTSLSAGNVLTLTVTINASPAPPILTAPTVTNNVSCQGSPPTLTVNSGTTTPVTVAVWYSNNVVVNVGPSYTPPASLAPGTYTYSVIDSLSIPNGCINAPQSANTVTLSLVVNPSPTAPSTTSNSLTTECQNQSPAVVLNATPTGTLSSVPVWYNGNTYVTTGNTYTPPVGTPTTTVYTVIDSSIVAPNHCTSLSTGNVLTLTVTVNPSPTQPVFTAPTGQNDTICQAFPTALTVSSGTLSVIPVWYSGNTFLHAGNSYIPPANLPVGTYTYSIIDSVAAPNGCINALPSANTVTLALYVNQTPTVNVSGAVIDSANCGKLGGVSNLNPSDVFGGTAPYHYQWYNGGSAIPGDTSINLTNIPTTGTSGVYSLQVIDAHGCVAVTPLGTSGTFTVPSVTSPVPSFSTTPDPATGAIPLTIAFTNQTIGVNTYTWTFGDGNTSYSVSPSNTYTAVGTYTATLIASNGSCKDSTHVTIITQQATMMIIPNIFTPNGDNINDVFYIINTGMISLTCDIYNRWGQLLHTITAPNQGWDGIEPNGDKAPDGTYLFILQAQGNDGKTYKQQGTVTLIR